MEKTDDLAVKCPKCGGNLSLQSAPMQEAEKVSCGRCGFAAAKLELKKIITERAKERSIKAARQMIDDMFKKS